MTGDIMDELAVDTRGDTVDDTVDGMDITGDTVDDTVDGMDITGDTVDGMDITGDTVDDTVDGMMDTTGDKVVVVVYIPANTVSGDTAEDTVGYTVKDTVGTEDTLGDVLADEVIV